METALEALISFSRLAHYIRDLPDEKIDKTVLEHFYNLSTLVYQEQANNLTKAGKSHSSVPPPSKN